MPDSIEPMTTESLFVYGVNAPDPRYNAIRDNPTPEEHQTRLLLEEMWQKYKPYADREFQQQIQCDFDSRFWEMYLACTLVDNAVPLSSKYGRASTGPDILVDDRNRRTWVEAIVPTAGAEVNPDRVSDPVPNMATTVPKDGILLRYRAAIEEKHKKYLKYAKDRIVAPTDAYVIAINGCRIPWATYDADWRQRPPSVLEALFPIERVWNESSSEGWHDSFRFRNGINRLSGARVETKVFLDPQYAGVSAVIWAHVTPGQVQGRMGSTFVLIHNPLASNQLSEGFLRAGREYRAAQRDDGYVLMATDWD